MRPVVAAVLVAACLHARVAAAQNAYAAVLLQYLGGDNAALAKLIVLDHEEIKAGIAAFETTRARQVLTGAAAMHTEAAIRSAEGRTTSRYHLDVATAIVEYGESSGRKSNASFALHPQTAAPVSDAFRLTWYCVVISAFENSAMVPAADKYIDHALALFPANPEVLMLAGIADEMRASPRTASSSDRERRKALESAEGHFRAVVAAAPDRLEARLRLGRVLQQRNKGAEARTLLTPLTSASDERTAYLALLFLGGIEDAEHHPDAACAAYDRAAARLPNAQAARLAASELRRRLGDAQAAADAIPAAAGAANSSDPWWTYPFGEYWRLESLLGTLHGMRQA